MFVLYRQSVFPPGRGVKLAGLVVDGTGVAGDPLAQPLVHVCRAADLGSLPPSGSLRARRRNQPGAGMGL